MNIIEKKHIEEKADLLADRIEVILKKAYPNFTIVRMDASRNPNTEIELGDQLVVFALYYSNDIICAINLSWLDVRNDDRWDEVIGSEIQFINRMIAERVKEMVGAYR